MDHQAGHLAAAVDEHTGLRLDRSTAAVSVDSLVWRVHNFVAICWAGKNHANSTTGPTDRNRYTVLCVDPSVRFDGEKNIAAFDQCVANAAAAGASTIVLPLGTLGLPTVATATAWGFESRKIIQAIRRAVDTAGIDVALATSNEDRLGKTAIGDWCDLVDRMNAPAIGMALDLRDAALDGNQAAEAIQTLGGRVRHVYAADTMSAENAEQILQALSAIRFAGTCALPNGACGQWLSAVERVNARGAMPTEARHAD